MVCEHVISIWCEASMRCNQNLYASRRFMESKRLWMSFWGMSLYAACMRVHKASRVGVEGPWRISCWPTISQTCSMGDMSGKHAGQGSSDTRHLWREFAQSLPCVAGHCPAEISHVELPEGETVPRAVKPPECNSCCSVALNSRRHDRILYPMPPQTITLGIGPLCRWRVQALGLHSPE